MKFLNVSVQNFMSFQDQQVLKLSDQGLIGIIGNNKDASKATSNGGGKSSLLVDSIVWCLWGKSPRGLSISDIVNETAKKDCQVTATIEDSGNIYRITRTAGAKTKKANDVLVQINDHQTTMGINKDTQDLINIIIGMDYSTFLQSVMLIAGQKSFCSMTDREQKEVLESILCLNILSDAREKVRDRIKQLQAELVDINNKITQNTQIICSLEHKLTKTREEETQYKVLKSSRIGLVENSIKELDVKKLDILEKLKDSDKLLAKINDCKTQLSILNKFDSEYFSKATEATSGLRKQKSNYEKQAAIWENDIKSLQNHAIRFSHIQDTICPNCLQEMSPDYVDNSLTNFDNKINELTNNVEKLNAAIVDCCAREQEIIISIKEQQKANSTKKSELLEILNKLSSEAAVIVKNKELLEYIENNIKKLNNEIELLKKEQNPYSSIVGELSLQLNEVQLEVDKLTNQKPVLDKEVQHLLFWDHGFSNQGLKSYVLDSVLPFLNERAQYYADMLSGGDLRIEFKTQTTLKSGDAREQFQVRVSNRQGSSKFEGNSDGERRRATIAVGLALGDLAASRTKKSINFRVLDEPMIHIDEAGRDAFFNMLMQETKKFESIFVITHDSDLKDQFPNYITIEKHRGISRIVERSYTC